MDHTAPAQDGFDNVSLSAKYQLWENAPHEWIFSIGGEVDLGDTGSQALGVDAFSTYTPTVYFGKGFGDLPNALKYLKPFALTGTRRRRHPRPIDQRRRLVQPRRAPVGPRARVQPALPPAARGGHRPARSRSAT